MNVEWVPILIAWIGGIPFGWLGYWSYDRFFKRRKRYFNITDTKNGTIHMEYHGQPPEDSQIQEIKKQLWG